MGGMANLTFTLPSGRTIGVTTKGDPIAEKIVVFCHPAPGSSVFDPDPTVTATRNVHMLAFDRPAYGSSDPLPPGHWPSIAQSADDIAEYLREMNRDESEIGVNRPKTVGVVGWSAGGRVALALAARHPDVVDRVAIIATPAPNEEVPWIDPSLQQLSDHLATLTPDAALSQLTEMLASQAEAVAAPDEVGDVPLEMLGESPVDAAALARPGARDRLGMMLRDAFRQGAGGVAADILSYTARPWGFEFSDVAAKTLIVNGQGDPLAGNAHATWYQRALPDARVQMTPGVGHMVVFPAWGDVLAHVAPGTVRR
ncbi:alpha/beta hydrolase [Leifsonia poae]|uniref:Alpha/beta hydrolase n=2 Tax=Leifsonia poae TaxID=110933 RepID=A0A9W6H7E9_9MICO|nr:alpha/beta hydrolase [Leifsonia poae]